MDPGERPAGCSRTSAYRSIRIGVRVSISASNMRGYSTRAPAAPNCGAQPRRTRVASIAAIGLTTHTRRAEKAAQISGISATDKGYLRNSGSPTSPMVASSCSRNAVIRACAAGQSTRMLSVFSSINSPIIARKSRDSKLFSVSGSLVRRYGGSPRAPSCESIALTTVVPLLHGPQTRISRMRAAYWPSVDPSLPLNDQRLL